MTSDSEQPLRFDWAVVRWVPRVHREEFHNVGVILYIPTERRLLVRLMHDDQLAARELGTGAQTRLATIEAICMGKQEGGPIATLSASERFHWLTAPRSAVIQTSPVRIGLTRDPEHTIDELFKEQCV